MYVYIIYGKQCLIQKWTLPQIEILIYPTIYKDKMMFLASHISYMEINEISEKIEMDMQRNRNPYITYESQGQRTIFMVLYIIYGNQCE